MSIIPEENGFGAEKDYENWQKARTTLLLPYNCHMETNEFRADPMPDAKGTGRNLEGERPMWHRPSLSLLEVETATLTTGGAFAEAGFTSS